jgi:hypothetical protein
MGWWIYGAAATRSRQSPSCWTSTTPSTRCTAIQLSLCSAHYDERYFLPIHVYDAASGHCLLTVFRPGKTSDGKEIRGHLPRLVRRIRTHWPATRITFRGDSHYGRKEVMDWCERNDVTYIFGLAPNKVLGGTGVSETRRMLCSPRACPGGEGARLRCDTLCREVRAPGARWRGSRRCPEPKRVFARADHPGRLSYAQMSTSAHGSGGQACGGYVRWLTRPAACTRLIFGINSAELNFDCS